MTEKITNEYKAGLSQRLHDSGINSPEAAGRLVYDEILALIEADDNDMTIFQKDATLPFVSLVQALRKHVSIPDSKVNLIPVPTDNYVKEIVMVVTTALSFLLLMGLFKCPLWLSTILSILVSTALGMIVKMFAKQESAQITESIGQQTEEVIANIALFAKAYDDIVRHSGEQQQRIEEEKELIHERLSLENQYSIILDCLRDLYGDAVETGSDFNRNDVAKSVKRALSSYGYDLIPYNGENMELFVIIGDGDMKNLVMGVPALYSREKRAIVAKGKLYR